MKKDIQRLRTWIEIDRKKLKHNYGVFRSILAKKTKLMAVVKSNAYGHSLINFSEEVVKLGADWLGVDSVVEALALRRAGITVPILILGYTLPSRICEAVDNDISLTISSFDSLKSLSKQKFSRPVKIHIKVDTGMHRQGFSISEIPKVLSFLNAKRSTLNASGLYTHFASAKNPAFPQFTKKQLVEFKLWIVGFEKSGFKPIVHASASAGTILFPESHFDMVRIGIGLYGVWPANEVKEYRRDKFSLKPIMSWKTIVSEIKKIKKDEKVGYDSTEILARDSILAVCPVGYWHGFPRALSSIGRVVLKGELARVVGRVSMDMVVIDITHIRGVKLHEEVILLGEAEKSNVTADDIANLTDRSPYEIITCINPLIKRIYK